MAINTIENLRNATDLTKVAACTGAADIAKKFDSPAPETLHEMKEIKASHMEAF